MDISATYAGKGGRGKGNKAYKGKQDTKEKDKEMATTMATAKQKEK